MRWNLSSNRVNGNDRRSPRKNFTEEDREERLVNFDGQKSDGGILFARVWNRDSCNRRLVPLSADPNRANPLPSLTRTGRNHCEQSSYSQRSPGAPVSSLFIADTLDVSRQEFRFEETVDGHIRHRFFGTDGKSFEKADNDFVKNKTWR